MIQKIIFAAVIILVSIVHASSASVKPKEVQLTAEECLDLLGTIIHKMESYEKVVKEGDRERPVKVYYKYDVGVRMALARNIPVLEAVTKAAEKARIDAINAVSDGKGIVATDTAANLKFQVIWRDILSKPQTLNLFTITEADLKLGENPLPASVLASILPIMEQ